MITNIKEEQERQEAEKKKAERQKREHDMDLREYHALIEASVRRGLTDEEYRRFSFLGNRYGWRAINKKQSRHQGIEV
jgi:hypothetical protein